MSWNKVTIDVDGENINAYLKNDESQLELKNVIDVGDTIKVKNIEYNLAKASKPKKEKKSDGKSTKG
jgi:hypothetical protein